jgi:hypothetical protein
MRSAYASTSAPALSDSATAITSVSSSAAAPTIYCCYTAVLTPSASVSGSNACAEALAFSVSVSFSDEQRQRRCLHLLQQFQL